MFHCQSLLVALAAASIVVASPCKPSTTSPILSTATTTTEETYSTGTSSVGDTTVDTSATVSCETTTFATTTQIDTTTTAAPTTATTETDADITATATLSETTSAGTAAPTACGIYGYFVEGNTLQYLENSGTKANTKDCLQACADYPECEVIDYYNEGMIGYPQGTCEFWKGTVKTDGSQTSPYQWYQVGCLANM
ncbi:hypothetical protein FBEOM_11476 [Fusarium beomiforme]|uniref:Apple domain-containing protein n=1 Tax=Fusarium beomiforme TaxID=44412 RepID=A0A9P5DUC1_9HYPO|nr:hypothetical protein FBEOM_11476 [Fusarium beomiforme]